MRIVFFDFDGVLNTRALVDRAPLPLVLGPDLLAADAVTRVERLAAETRAAVVARRKQCSFETGLTDANAAAARDVLSRRWPSGVV